MTRHLCFHPLPLSAALVLAVLASGAALCLPARAADGPDAVLEGQFRQPRDADKPWAYWWWLKGNVTEASIRRDLAEMKRQGFAGLLLFDARGYHEDHVPPPPAKMEFMSDQWRRMFRFALDEAERQGLKMSVNLSSCAGALKGPWEVGDDAPKKLIWTAAEVRGPKRVEVVLQRPEGIRFWDIALLAARHAAPADAAEPAASSDPAAALSGNWQEAQPRKDGGPTLVEVVSLADKIDPQGRLRWDAPPGVWTLLRLGCTTMAGHEYDVDILDPTAVAGHYERMGKVLLQDAGQRAGRTLTHFYSVSWEGAAPTWSLGLDREFAQYRGYAPLTYLPVLAGWTVTSAEVSERFERDYRKTLGDCFMNNFYGRLRQLCNAAGLKWHSESGGPWTRALPQFQHADQLAFLARNDMPQGEFWYSGRAMNRPPAMAAHIYGLPLAATEAFTHMIKHWSAYPAALKPFADSAFCDGVNHFIWHTFSASPVEFGKPGIEYFAGTHVNPNVTWWEQAGGILAYLARCQLLLRQGRFVADVCCYTGDNPYLHWGRGEKWIAKPSLTLGRGCTYDLINTEVLLERVRVEGGDLVLPDGMRYRLLAVDLADETATPAALQKIIALAEAGATVVLGRQRPQRVPGLKDYPASDGEIRSLATQLWDGASAADGRSAVQSQTEPASPSRRALGRGTVISGTPLDEVLAAAGILPDYVGPHDYIHRRTEDGDIYFIAGTGSAEGVFRVQGREPEFWDPVTGQIRDAVCWQATGDGRTAVPIQLAKNGSVFVVFRRPAQRQRLTAAAPADRGLEIAGRTQAGMRVNVWQNGSFGLTAASDKKIDVAVSQLPAALTLAGPWQVRFAPGWGAPESAVFKDLTAWDKHPDAGIKHFSGSATYRQTFRLSDAHAAKLVRLQLGAVHHIARVRLNGRDLGVVWTDPWTVDLTGVARAGDNELEIEVTNTWVNRLIGDAVLPPEKRLTRSNVALYPDDRKLRAFQGFTPRDPLVTSGLLGPVRVEFGEQRELGW
ncbi:MAG: hypothetical protein GX575_17820 [Candidatus Anammoximicrobium sp.]|nr:hypothetical protein [Candidatus Anammoximicrobium sp.]